jgi:hypothetical protein
MLRRDEYRSALAFPNNRERFWRFMVLLPPIDHW